MTVGRNDPCPCGSGKKYKKCCLGKGQATTPAAPASPAIPPASVSPRRARATPQPLPNLPPLPPPPPPRQRTPEEERAVARWKDFESADAEGRIALFKQTLDDPDLMDDEMSFEMLNRLHDDLVERGERGRFAELVAALRKRRPEVYPKNAHYLLSWLLQDALAENRQDVLPLARDLAATAGRAIDVFNRSVEALAYHGRLDAIVEALRIAWPDVRSSSSVVPWGITEFANRGANHEIYAYLEQTEVPDPADAGLLERIKFYVPDPDLDFLPRFIGDVADWTAGWKVDDFTLRPARKKTRGDWDDEEESEEAPDPGAANLSRLIAQFVGYLRRQEGAAYPRAELTRHELYRYFLQRHHGELDPQPSMLERMRNPRMKLPPPPRPGHPLCPERVTLDVFLAGFVGPLNGLYHRAAAVFEILPAWLRFLEVKGLIDADRRARTVAELRPMHATVLTMWEKFRDDPALFRAAQAWPEDAAKGPTPAPS